MKIGLQPNLFLQSSIEDAVKQTIELKPDCIEIVYEKPQFPPSIKENLICEKLKSILSTYNVESSVHSSFRGLNIGSESPEERKNTLKQTEKCIKFAYNIDAKKVTVHSGYSLIPSSDKNSRLAARERFEEDLKDCVKMANDYSLKLAVENMDNPQFYVCSLSEAAELAEKIDGLSITFDVAHLHIYKSQKGISAPEKQIAEETISLLSDHLTHLHLSDNIGAEDRHLIPGDGLINFKPIVDAVKKINYNGQVIVELWKPSNPVKAGIKALSVVQKMFNI